MRNTKTCHCHWVIDTPGVEVLQNKGCLCRQAQNLRCLVLLIFPLLLLLIIILFFYSLIFTFAFFSSFWYLIFFSVISSFVLLLCQLNYHHNIFSFSASVSCFLLLLLNLPSLYRSSTHFLFPVSSSYFLIFSIFVIIIFFPSTQNCRSNF